MLDQNSLKKEFNADASKVTEWLNAEFAKVRTGRANPAVFYGIKVDNYGAKTPLNQVANISVPEPRKITIKPFDASQIKAIVAAINAANLGYTPVVNGEYITINVPQPTMDLRKQTVKQIKVKVEEAKNKIRDIRQKEHKKIHTDESVSEDIIRKLDKELDNLTKDWNNQIDSLFKAKEKELLTI